MIAKWNLKNLLNNISSDEKQRILEQHSGGKLIDTRNFRRLLESKLGDVKTLLTEGANTVFFTQPEIVLDGQTWEGQKKTFTGSWKASSQNPTGFTLTMGNFGLPSGGSVPTQINIKPNVETDIPFTLTLDPADTNQKSIFNFLNRDKKIFFNISVKVGEELENLTFTANFTQVSTQGTTGTGEQPRATGTGEQPGTGGSPAAEKINTTNDRAYDYKLSNGKYYFKGKPNTQYAKKYPNWVEAKGTGLGHIMTNVKF